MLWLSKALLQKVLSAVPGGHRINYRLQVASGSHSTATVMHRIPGVISFISAINRIQPLARARVLEIGTGWTAINAVLLSLLGAAEVMTIDHVRHARMREIRKVLAGARAHATSIADARRVPVETVRHEIDLLDATSDCDELFRRARIHYVAPADAGALNVPAGHFDVVCSYAVLAHVPEAGLDTLAAESKRILRPGGLVAHRIGLQDPFNALRNGNNVAFLRYSDFVWSILNSDIQSNNRLRASQHVRYYADLGAEIVVADTDVSDADRALVQGMRVAQQFAGLAPDDLAARAMTLICRF